MVWSSAFWQFCPLIFDFYFGKKMWKIFYYFIFSWHLLCASLKQEIAVRSKRTQHSNGMWVRNDDALPFCCPALLGHSDFKTKTEKKWILFYKRPYTTNGSIRRPFDQPNNVKNVILLPKFYKTIFFSLFFPQHFAWFKII